MGRRGCRRSCACCHCSPVWDIWCASGSCHRASECVGAHCTVGLPPLLWAARQQPGSFAEGDFRSWASSCALLLLRGPLSLLSLLSLAVALPPSFLPSVMRTPSLQEVAARGFSSFRRCHRSAGMTVWLAADAPATYCAYSGCAARSSSERPSVDWIASSPSGASPFHVTLLCAPLIVAMSCLIWVCVASASCPSCWSSRPRPRAAPSSLPQQKPARPFASPCRCARR